MKKLAVTLVLLLAAPCIWAGSITVNFDNIPTGTGVAPVPSSYDGFSWDANWYAVSHSYYSGYGNTVSFPSEPNVAYNAFGVMTVSVANGIPMQLTSLEAAWWAANNNQASYSSTTLTIVAFMNGIQVGTDVIQLGTNFVLSNANLPLANSWTFNNDGVSSHWWLVDNLTFTSSAPEPSTPVLLGVSLLAAAAIGMGRKLRKLGASSTPGAMVA